MEYELKTEGKFSYIEAGEGPVLLLLHGLFGALSNWASVIDNFSKQYKVVIPMMPIFGLGLRDTNVYGLAKFIKEFTDYKGYSGISVMGNSLGGHVGLIFTLQNMDTVKNLILTGSSGLYENSFGGGYPKRQDYNFIKARTEFTFYDPATATPALVDEVYGIVNDKHKALRVVTMAKAAIRHNLSDQVHKITQPVCLIWGRNDNITPPEVAEEFNAKMPNSELHWIDKCGHAPMMEQPEEFNRYLDDFLSRQYSTPSVLAA